MPTPPLCLILVPCPTGSPLPECEERLRELEGQGYAVWRLRGSGSIETVRSQAATDALAKGFAELMWIDGDVIFEPDDIEKLRGLNRPMVGGLVARTKGRQFAAAFLPETESIQFGLNGGLLELGYIGFGFVYTRREVCYTICIVLNKSIFISPLSSQR